MTQIQYDVPGYYCVAHNGTERLALMQLAPNGPIQFGEYGPMVGGSPYMYFHSEDWSRLLEWYSSPDAVKPDGTPAWPLIEGMPSPTGYSLWDEVIGGAIEDPRYGPPGHGNCVPLVIVDAWCSDGMEDAYYSGGSFRKRAEIVEWFMAQANDLGIDLEDAFIPELGPRP